jgi:glycosyltransferase involved in cell wall biosynthesis
MSSSAVAPSPSDGRAATARRRSAPVSTECLVHAGQHIPPLGSGETRVTPVTRRTLRVLGARPGRFAWDSPIRSIELWLEGRGVPRVENDQALTNFLGRALKRLGLLRNLRTHSSYVYFTPLMGAAEGRLFPQCYWAESIPYCYDCWPPQYEWWVMMFRRQRTRVAFFSARESAERMRTLVPGLDAIWLPEAIEPAFYSPVRPLEERSIDVLEFGRHWPAYHDRIRDHCVARGLKHLFEAKPGQLVFPTREAFLRGLADAKISVCFPSSLTHPERSGDVETMTLRYLESIASGCILVGRCPAEMRDLFGYNPVVDADTRDPAGQIDNILENLSAYDELLDRNCRRLLEIGTWDARLKTMLALLDERGYSSGPGGTREPGVCQGSG